MQTLVISSQLAHRYPAVYNTIKQVECPEIGFKVCEIDTRNLWVRDFMPVEDGKGGLVKFNYKGYGAGFDAFPWLKVGRKVWDIFPTKKVQSTQLVLDGGNIKFLREVGYDIALVTQIVFRHNPRVKPARLTERLEKLLNAEIVYLPVEPGDDIGHSDGCLHPVSPFHGGATAGRFQFSKPKPTVLLNDYRRMFNHRGYQRYADEIEQTLSRHGIEFAHFPYAYHKCPTMTEHVFRRQFPEADSFNPGYGYYINLLELDHVVFLPSFGIDEDDEAYEVAKKWFPGKHIRRVTCHRLAMEGGLINCVSADYDF